MQKNMLSLPQIVAIGVDHYCVVFLLLWLLSYMLTTMWYGTRSCVPASEQDSLAAEWFPYVLYQYSPNYYSGTVSHAHFLRMPNLQ